jgi:hypothetical protein
MHIQILLTLLLSSSAFANIDGAFLDNKYPNLVHPNKSEIIRKGFEYKSDTLSVINFQSSVKSQSSRGTCSIFSATAYLEGLLIKRGSFNKTLDLSEEWLQYTSVRNRQSDGSSAWSNFNAIASYGMPGEQTLPYIGEDWTKVFSSLKDLRCGKLSGADLNSCLIVHRDPKMLIMSDAQIMSVYSDREFINARNEANHLKQTELQFSTSNYFISNVSEVKKNLRNKIPVVVEVDFYYGAWNHRSADEYNIRRDTNLWNLGIVTSPELGSVDMLESSKHPAGHSVLVVGYDDNVIVEKLVRLTNGTTKKVTYKGVYYFKNSWGTSSFGKDFQIDGVKYPGYGMMVQDYAEKFGQFFVLPLM